jgi:DNA-binding response OmpR family regulator
VGRDTELLRIGELLDEEVLFLIYGVAGIGKTELALRALEIARQRPRWKHALPTLVQVQPGMTEQHFIAVLRHRTGADTARAERLSGPARSLAEELEPVVHALEAHSSLVFLDDVHLIESAAVARILGHLARHVRSSRVFAASRFEIPIVTEGVGPVITRLAPMPDADARRMLAHLGRRLGVDIADVDGILRRAGGSPFFLQREVASSVAGDPPPAADRLVSTLRTLPPPARRLLLTASVIAGRAKVVELSTGGGRAADWLALLARHFFVEVADGAVAVHDLVREAVLRVNTPLEISRARRAAARVFARRALAGGPEAPLAAVEMARQLCTAGDHDAALASVAQWHGLVSGAGLDHLLRDTLEQLRKALPAHATSIDMLLARTLVRRGLIAEAEAVLTRVASDNPIAGSVRYLTLAGMIATQRGDLRTAEACLQRAHDAAKPDTTGGERARVALHLADVLSMRGDTARARAILEEVRPICDALGSRTVLRWGWSATLSRVFDEEFATAIATAAPFRELASTVGAADLAVLLTMLEVLSRAELQDAAGARELTDRIIAPAAHAGALRAPIASFYMAIAAWAEGDLRAAELALRESWRFLQTHQSEIVGLIVGHYLARVQLVLGDAPAAVALFARTTLRSTEIGLDGLTSLGEVYHAHALVAAGEPRAARVLAERSVGEHAADRRVPSHVRMLAHQVIALVSAYEGELTAARAHIEAALGCAVPEAAQHIDTLLVRAEVELCGGNPAVVVQSAGVARHRAAEQGCRFLEARACVALAAGCAALGGPGDLAMAEEALARVDALTTRYGYEGLRLRAILVRAAMLTRTNERGAAERLLGEELAHGAGRAGDLDLLLGSALGSRRDHELPPGLAAQLALLGFAHAALAEPEVIVDLPNATMATHRAVVKKRPIACALLACLADAEGQVVPAEVLYRTVWGATEYHPLRHRNTLYVAMKRLRQILAELCTRHHDELIETLPGGWRLVRGLVARQMK